MVNKISWQKAGGVAEPGRYMFTFGWLIVTADDIAVWKQHPQAMFTLVKLPAAAEADLTADSAEVAEEFHLGSFELPSPSSHGGF